MGHLWSGCFGVNDIAARLSASREPGEMLGCGEVILEKDLRRPEKNPSQPKPNLIEGTMAANIVSMGSDVVELLPCV